MADTRSVFLKPLNLQNLNMSKRKSEIITDFLFICKTTVDVCDSYLYFTVFTSRQHKQFLKQDVIKTKLRDNRLRSSAAIRTFLELDGRSTN